MIDPSSEERVAQYLSKCGLYVKLERFLGDGTDGSVWESSRKTAIKVLRYENGYYNERDSYLRLAEWGVTEKINGFWVPKMLAYDDDLLVVEMDMMQHPPYIIDFAKVKIDRSPDFSTETLREHHRQCRQWFGGHWPEVQSLLAALESYQIYYLDPRPGNITFPDMR
jgi:hypothetical protein